MPFHEQHCLPFLTRKEWSRSHCCVNPPPRIRHQDVNKRTPPAVSWVECSVVLGEWQKQIYFFKKRILLIVILPWWSWSYITLPRLKNVYSTWFWVHWLFHVESNSKIITCSRKEGLHVILIFWGYYAFSFIMDVLPMLYINLLW